MVESARAAGTPRPLAAFSTDVEDYFQAEALREWCPRDRWATLDDRCVANTERLLALLERLQVRGTFYILGWIAAGDRSAFRARTQA